MSNETAEIIPAVSDAQLLDLYMTGWVAGAVDNWIRDLTRSEQNHVTTCPDCANEIVALYKRRLEAAWDDPAVRAAVVEACRAVLARETDRAPRFISTTTPIDDDDLEGPQ